MVMVAIRGRRMFVLGEAMEVEMDGACKLQQKVGLDAKGSAILIEHSPGGPSSFFSHFFRYFYHQNDCDGP